MLKDSLIEKSQLLVPQLCDDETQVEIYLTAQYSGPRFSDNKLRW